MIEVAERAAPPPRAVLTQVGRSPATRETLRFFAALAVAIVGFSVLLLLQSRNPITTYLDVFQATLGTAYGRSEVAVKMIPLLLTALAVAVPGRVGLVNVGGEGQLYMGAWLATWAAISFTRLPAVVMLPFMLILAMIGGSIWAFIPALLRARGWMNETISSLLLNYVASSSSSTSSSARGRIRTARTSPSPRISPTRRAYQPLAARACTPGS